MNFKNRNEFYNSYLTYLFLFMCHFPSKTRLFSSQHENQIKDLLFSVDSAASNK